MKSNQWLMRICAKAFRGARRSKYLQLMLPVSILWLMRGKATNAIFCFLLQYSDTAKVKATKLQTLEAYLTCAVAPPRKQSRLTSNSRKQYLRGLFCTQSSKMASYFWLPLLLWLSAFQLSNAIPLDVEVVTHNARDISTAETHGAIAKSLYAASIRKRDQTHSANTTLDKSWQDAPLFSM